MTDPVSDRRTEWVLAVKLTAEIVAGRTTARLNRAQRAAVSLVLERGQESRAQLIAQLGEAHQDRRRLRAELEDMRRRRDAQRKRADRLSRGTWCGKVPLRDEDEASRFVALVCSMTGESPAAYVSYICVDCPAQRDERQPLHIGHVVPRSQRPAVTAMSASLGERLGGEALARLQKTLDSNPRTGYTGVVTEQDAIE